MSFVTVVPDFVGQAAGQLENVGSALNAASAAAAAPTTGLLAAAGDEVSAAIASLFSSHAQEFQAVNAQAAAFQSQFTNLLNAGAGSYLSTEVTNAGAAAASGDIFPSFSGNFLSLLTGANAQQLELPLDVAGPVVVAARALEPSGIAFVNAVRAGDSAAAMTVLGNAGPIAGNAFVYGQDTVSIPLPGSISGLQAITLDIPFGGLLAPLQQITLTVATPGNPPIIFPLGLEVGGLVTNLQANGPEVLLALLLLGGAFL
ncbi:PE family protein [Mycobacterium angelicum]|uniref:PE domain-containing protein n=1 Tax=Mycobacterium angelicum TaxID=470074 RepID=A0A1W9ZND5_MYCAN|nr:PE family protein [Mycobacterium angelicum]MCV7198798.1 PE family protein [Mycobacterium angelicum]ORA19347.1 hypothetical protein BST12_17260 [Mycobacterium angelicum]